MLNDMVDVYLNLSAGWHYLLSPVIEDIYHAQDLRSAVRRYQDNSEINLRQF